eukprot:TRINITY_DN5669_c0_g1_i2.p1 TRINITY_DN5669_c0_g1~~TRINITY_DN5669_c0_g1_i2.p1  ORF type:complete len:641 (+),score=-133.37 TRINITY_DN5669_c0_g1_i2:1-1923(+)
MISVTLEDGRSKDFEGSICLLEALRAIDKKLAKETVAAEWQGQLLDLRQEVAESGRLKPIKLTDPEGLEILRHSTAHLLAHAVKTLYPHAKIAIGPVVESGFYYDIELAESISTEDLCNITREMKRIVSKNYPVIRSQVSRDAAIRIFTEKNETYKVEIISALPEEAEISLYQQGDFTDLCRGPHVPSTGYIRAFQLTKVAGAYWRGEAANPMLRRIYGTAWPTEGELSAYLKRLEEAEKRDHRKLAQKMGLFHFQKEAPGMVFWHPRGWTLNQVIRRYIQSVVQRDYQEVNTPQLVDRTLWEASGHWGQFSAEMFSLKSDHKDYAIKPMNCPCHIQLFKQGLKSYRELPLRFFEFGCCHRQELSGALHGLMRVRAMTQDDGHIFCTESQMHQEVLKFMQQLHTVYTDFGFTELIYKLATRPVQRVGETALWDKAEQALSQALDESGVNWEVLPGEGAFYGPKIEFSLKDCLGRIWQCGTIQVDFSMPARLGAEYVNTSGEKEVPVLLHRAILGSLERFIGILLEHYAGFLPLWLSPVQVVVMSVTEKQNAYAQHITDLLERSNIRASLDLRNEKIGFKIREHAMARVPYQVIIGDRECESETISARCGTMHIEAVAPEVFVDKLLAEIHEKQPLQGVNY